MAFYESNVHRSSSMSHVEDPGAEDLQGFIDDDPTHSLVSLEHNRRQLFLFDGKKLIFCMGVCAVVGVAIGLGIIFGEYEAPPHKVKGGKTGGSGKQHWLMDPPSLPADLHVLCAPLNLQTDEGYNACLEKCQPAECCDKIPESPLSCVDTHRKDCEQYRASCQHLDHVKATTNEVTVEKICATDSLMTVDGVKACTDMCESFKCCFDGSTDCDISEAVCADHGACVTALLVDSSGFVNHSEAKETIENACQDLSTYEGQTKCTNVCSPAVCCFLSPTAWKQPCSITCDHYEACSQLYGPVLRSNVDEDLVYSVPHQVEQACNPAQLKNVSGVRECFELCQHHLCCFDNIEGGGCLDTNLDECYLYSACRALIDFKDSEEQQPAEMCEPKFVEQAGPTMCMQACSKSYCCLFDPRYESSCANDEICSTFYQPCAILAPAKSPPEDSNLVTNVQTTCTESNLASALGATECENDCAERGCCIETGAGNCQTSDPQYCQEIKSCQLLFKIDPTPEIDDKTVNAYKTNGTNVITKKLQSTCALENLATLSGYHNCYDQCYFHLCCFTDNDYLNCKDDKGEVECAEYSPCQALLQTSRGDPPNLEEACSRTSLEIASGLKSCQEGCASHLCCFQDPNLPSSCVGWFGRRECDKYESCKVLVSDASHALYNEEDPYLVALIDNYCKPENIADQESARHCMAQCEKRECCFLTGDCYESNKEWCDEIIACTNHPLIQVPKLNINTTVGDWLESDGDDVDDERDSSLPSGAPRTDGDSIGDWVESDGDGGERDAGDERDPSSPSEATIAGGDSIGDWVKVDRNEDDAGDKQDSSSPTGAPMADGDSIGDWVRLDGDDDTEDPGAEGDISQSGALQGNSGGDWVELDGDGDTEDPGAEGDTSPSVANSGSIGDWVKLDSDDDTEDPGAEGDSSPSVAPQGGSIGDWVKLDGDDNTEDPGTEGGSSPSVAPQGNSRSIGDWVKLDGDEDAEDPGAEGDSSPSLTPQGNSGSIGDWVESDGDNEEDVGEDENSSNPLGTEQGPSVDGAGRKFGPGDSAAPSISKNPRVTGSRHDSLP